MKKKIILALALLAAVVSTLALPALASFHSHEAVEGNTVCTLCQGTGLSNGGRGPFRCHWCNGTGFKGSY